MKVLKNKESEPINHITVSRFLADINLAVEKYTPLSKTKCYRSSLPAHILRLIRQKKELYRLRRNNDQDNIDLKKRYNQLNKTINFLVNEYRTHTWTEACSNINQLQGKNYWNEIKKLSRYKKSSPNKELFENGVVFKTAKEKACLFAKHFENVYKGNDKNGSFNPNCLKNITNWFREFNKCMHTPNLDFDNITEEEYFSILNSGKNTAPGHDNIKRDVLRKFDMAVHKKIIRIYNYCLKFSYFPEEWKLGIITTIAKPNSDSTKAENYRPITLLPVLGKIFEKLIKSRMEQSFGSRIPQNQFGFRQNSSTIHPLIILTSNVQITAKKGNNTAALFLDIKKAFDSVWHEGLIFKLLMIKCPTYLIKIIISFLEKRIVKVRVDNELSDSFGIEQGTPQGSPLSPLLYNIYCYDLIDPIHDPSNYTLQFADDTALIAHGTNPHDAIEKLQLATNGTLAWMNKWRITPNPSKFQLIIFNHSLNDYSPVIKIEQNFEIKPSDRVKYLGVWLDSKLNFNLNTKVSKQHCVNRAKHFKSLIYKREGISIKTATHIYKMICRPIVEYGCILYNCCHNPALKNIAVAETKSLRAITKLRNKNNPLYNPSNELLYKMTRVEPIITRMSKITDHFKNKEGNMELLKTLSLSPRDIGRAKRKKPVKLLFDVLN